VGAAVVAVEELRAGAVGPGLGPLAERAAGLGQEPRERRATETPAP
jgi:hypothetical protein